MAQRRKNIAPLFTPQILVSSIAAFAACANLCVSSSQRWAPILQKPQLVYSIQHRIVRQNNKPQIAAHCLIQNDSNTHAALVFIIVECEDAIVTCANKVVNIVQRGEGICISEIKNIAPNERACVKILRPNSDLSSPPPKVKSVTSEGGDAVHHHDNDEHRIPHEDINSAFGIDAKSNETEPQKRQKRQKRERTQQGL